METVYTKRFIKSIDDLPKETGVYFVFVKDDNEIQQWTYNKGSDTDDSADWLNGIDWFLEPRELPTDEEIDHELHHEQHETIDDEGNINRWIYYWSSEEDEAFTRGVKWLRDKIK
jgi:hypothetical protein